MAVQVNGQLSDYVSNVDSFGEACEIICFAESWKIVEFRICYKLHLRCPMKKHSQVSNWSNNWFYKFKAQCCLWKHALQRNICRIMNINSSAAGVLFFHSLHLIKLFRYQTLENNVVLLRFAWENIWVPTIKPSRMILLNKFRLHVAESTSMNTLICVSSFRFVCLSSNWLHPQCRVWIYLWRF